MKTMLIFLLIANINFVFAEDASPVDQKIEANKTEVQKVKSDIKEHKGKIEEVKNKLKALKR